MKRFLLLFAAASFTTGLLYAQQPACVLASRPNNNYATTIGTAAGTGIEGFNGDSVSVHQAQFNSPSDVAIDTFGNVYIADWYNARIRKINALGIIKTIAGTGRQGYSGDAGPATAAKINYPNRITLDQAGNIYFTDVFYNSVRKIDTSGVITTFAGNGKAGHSGDNDLAILASINYPSGLACDKKGNVFISDRQNNCIRKVDANGIITTIAGNGDAGFTGDGGYATGAQLFSPNGIAVDTAGNVLIATADHHIRKVTPQGMITTIAGNGNVGYTGDGNMATAATLSNPAAVATDVFGNIFIADFDNNKIRVINKEGIINTLAGTNKEGFSGDGGLANAAQLFSPSGLVADNRGLIYVADNGNNRIRYINTRGKAPVHNTRQEPVTSRGTYVAPAFNNLGSHSTSNYYSYPTGSNNNLYYANPSPSAPSPSVSTPSRTIINTGGNSSGGRTIRKN